MNQPRSVWTDARIYAHSFGRLCAGTVEPVLDELTGEGRLLDVGTGTGTVLRAALDRGWDALGVDPEPSMLAEAARHVAGARLQLAGLPTLPFEDDTFDAVVANFVVNHLEDPRSGVRELARVLKPGGRLVVTLWPAEVSAMNDLWNRVMAWADVQPLSGMRLPPHLDFERSPEGAAGLLCAAGLIARRVSRLDWLFTIPPGDLWSGVRAGIGVVGQTYVRGTAAVRASLDRAFEALAPGLTEGGLLRLESQAVIALGDRE